MQSAQPHWHCLFSGGVKKGKLPNTGNNKSLLKLIVLLLPVLNGEMNWVGWMEQNRLEQHKVNNSIFHRHQIFDSFRTSLLFLTTVGGDKECLLFPLLAFSHPQSSSCLQEVLSNISVSVPQGISALVDLLSSPSRTLRFIWAAHQTQTHQGGGCTGFSEVVSHTLHWGGWAPLSSSTSNPAQNTHTEPKAGAHHLLLSLK